MPTTKRPRRSSPATSLERRQYLLLSDWANLHCHLIFIYSGPVAPEWRRVRVDAPDLTAWLIQRGRVEVKVDGQVTRASEGQWVFPKQGRRWQQFSADAEILSIRYRARWPTGDDLFSEGLGLCVPARECPELKAAALPLVRFVEAHFPRAVPQSLMEATGTLESHLRLQAHFSTWIVAAIEVLSRHGVLPSSMGPIDSRLLKAVQILDRRSLQEPIRERDLAQQVGLSCSQLNRLFARQYGRSARSYFECRRTEYAVSALLASPLAMKEISYQLGFAHPQHFTVWFQKRKGVSPTQFRARPRNVSA